MDSTAISSSSVVTDKYGYLQAQASQDDSGENLFLQLLVTQLRNQNPLEPLANEDFVQQMSSFAAVQETQSLNTKIGDLISLQQIVAGQNAFTQSATLVGKDVEFTDPATGEAGTGHVDAVHLTPDGLILDVSGKQIPLNLISGVVTAAPADSENDG